MGGGAEAGRDALPVRSGDGWPLHSGEHPLFLGARLGRSRALLSGVGSEPKLNFPSFLWASYLISRPGGHGRPGRLGFLSRSYIPPFREAGRVPPFVSRLAYLHVNTAPVPARPEVAPATGNAAPLGVVFLLLSLGPFSLPWGLGRPRRRQSVLVISAAEEPRSLRPDDRAQVPRPALGGWKRLRVSKGAGGWGGFTFPSPKSVA